MHPGNSVIKSWPNSVSRDCTILPSLLSSSLLLTFPSFHIADDVCLYLALYGSLNLSSKALLVQLETFLFKTFYFTLEYLKAETSLCRQRSM